MTAADNPKHLSAAQPQTNDCGEIKAFAAGFALRCAVLTGMRNRSVS